MTQDEFATQIIGVPGIPSAEAVPAPRLVLHWRFDCLKMDQPTDNEGFWIVQLTDEHGTIKDQEEGVPLRAVVNRLLDRWLGSA